MVQLVFRSKDNERVTTYIISLAWVFGISYTISSAIILIIRLRKAIKLRKQKDLEKSLPNNLRGGTEIELTSSELNECLKHDGAYEIIGSHLKLAIRKILNIRNLKKTLVVDRVVVLVASVFLSGIGSKIAVTGVDFIVAQTKAKVVAMVAGASGLGVVGAITILGFTGTLSLPLQFVVQLLMASLGVSTVLYGEFRLQFCDEQVVYLPKISPGAHYLDMGENNPGRIMMITDKSIKLYMETDSDEKCTVEVLGEEQGFFMNKEKSFERKCKTSKTYTPLNERTMTLKDLKEGDSTKNLEKTMDIGLSEKDSKAVFERIRK